VKKNVDMLEKTCDMQLYHSNHDLSIWLVATIALLRPITTHLGCRRQVAATNVDGLVVPVPARFFHIGSLR
jgi:hypothetical protein